MKNDIKVFQSTLDAVALLTKEGRNVTWGNLSSHLNIPPSTLRDGATRSGVETIKDLIAFSKDGGGKVLKDMSSNASLTSSYNSLKESLEMLDEPDGTVAVTSVSSKNKTIASIVKQCQVNLDLYDIVSPKVRKWDVPIKQKDADGATHLEIVECYYIGFSLVPKAALHIISPIVSHVKYPFPDRKVVSFSSEKSNSKLGKGVIGRTTRKEDSKEDSKGEIAGGFLGGVSSKKIRTYIHGSLVEDASWVTTAPTRTVVLSDPQIGYRKNHNSNKLDPFHDRHAMDVAMQITRQINPDTVIVNGDWLDMSEWSDKFVREPGFFFTTQPALFECHYWLQKLRRTLPNARIVYIEGNHEIRLKNSITSHLAALATLVDVRGESIGSLASLLGLESLGIEYLGGYPNNYLDLGPIVVAHGHTVSGKSPGTANNILQKIDKSHLVGHIHRPEFAVKTVSMSGVDKEIFVMTSGCLCRVDYVVPGHARGSVWQQGIVVLETSGEMVTPYQVPIRHGQAIFGGQVYKSTFDISELNAAGYDSVLIKIEQRHALRLCSMRRAKSVMRDGCWL